MDSGDAVVPGYYLVCYNCDGRDLRDPIAVVPGYYLVCYNLAEILEHMKNAVVPGYYLVCYNSILFSALRPML